MGYSDGRRYDVDGAELKLNALGMEDKAKDVAESAKDASKLRLLKVLDARLMVDGSIADCCRENTHKAVNPPTPMEPNNTKLAVVTCPTHDNPARSTPKTAKTGTQETLKSEARPRGLKIVN